MSNAYARRMRVNAGTAPSAGSDDVKPGAPVGITDAPVGDMVPSDLQRFTTAAIVVLAGVVATPRVAAADDECAIQDTDYDVLANIVIRDTPFGAANGTYYLGAGKMTLRAERHAGPRAVRLTAYDLSNHLTVLAKVAMVSTKVVTVSQTSSAHGLCDGARGTLDGSTLTWDTPVFGYHSDGTLECSGNMCGSFGAPPKGISPFHDTPTALRFGPLTFSTDGSTFTMPYTFVSKSSSPRQTTYLALSGRRTHARCAPAGATCPAART